MITPQFLGSIKDDKFLVNSPRFFSAYCFGLKDGDYALEIHKVKGMPKTLEQLAYYYAVVLPCIFNAIKEAGNDTIMIRIGERTKEIPLTIETVDLMLKDTYAKSIGKKIILKRNMSKEEASLFIDWCIMWAAKYLSCVIPEATGGANCLPEKDGLKQALYEKYKPESEVE